MLLIIAVIVGVIGFVRPTKYIEGMKIEVIETTTSDSWLFNKTVNYKLDITNVSNHDITTDLYITAYADNYEMLSTSIFITDLLPSKKTSDTITVFVGEKEWNKLQIYYKTNEEDEYKPLYTTYRKDIETH